MTLQWHHMCAMVTGEFPARMVSSMETISIWWRYHEKVLLNEIFSLFQHDWNINLRESRDTVVAKYDARLIPSYNTSYFCIHTLRILYDKRCQVCILNMIKKWCLCHCNRLQSRYFRPKISHSPDSWQRSQTWLLVSVFSFVFAV